VEELYFSWKDQIMDIVGRWGEVGAPGKYHVVGVLGMGGSGVVGDYLALLSNLRGGLPVIVSKSHLLPRTISSDDLVFAISYSGNTLETRLAVEKALRIGARIVVVSSDGLLEKLAAEKGVPFVGVVKGVAPRTALPSMLFAILSVLDASGLGVVSRGEAEGVAGFLGDVMRDAVNAAYDIADFIDSSKGLLILAGHSPWEALLVRGKNEFNENAKIPVKVDVAPEWMHNDIVGYEKPYKFPACVLAVKDPGDRVGSRLVDFMIDIYKGLGYPVKVLELRGASDLEKLMYGSLVLGLASVRLARMRGIDPLATESIHRYKSMVNEIFGV